jgi:hypothetical protein
LPHLDSAGLDSQFPEEVWSTIRALHPDKAPGQDGLTARFLQAAWDIVRPDFMATLDAFWRRGTWDLHAANEALMTLHPKSLEAATIADYRSILLIHIVGKLISKLLANRLAPKMGPLVHQSQCAFIKGHSIHENFRFVRSSARLFHSRWKATILFKADLTKAFDSVAWLFLLEILQCLGFLSSWRDWISELLQSASTKILLNGAPVQRICHARGLRQGDPPSSLLFVLVMETLNALFQKVDDCFLLQPLATRQIKHRVSLYADDLIMFIVPVASDLSLANEIFKLFREASGTRWNFNKCQVAPIRCSEEHISLATQLFPYVVVDFPIRYLGIPLSTTSLPNSAWYSLIDRVVDKMPVWKGNLMHKSGRLTLIK